jgi:hypothetical protein
VTGRSKRRQIEEVPAGWGVLQYRSRNKPGADRITGAVAAPADGTRFVGLSPSLSRSSGSYMECHLRPDPIPEADWNSPGTSAGQGVGRPANLIRRETGG